jgi:D-lactate dehydrogenase
VNAYPRKGNWKQIMGGAFNEGGNKMKCFAHRLENQGESDQNIRRDSKPMKITSFELEEWERQAFEKLRRQHDLELLSSSLSSSNVQDYADTEVLSTFIYSELDRSVLEQLPHLRLIATRSTGVDHIDLDYCEQHNVAVCNVPTYGDNTVAEHVFALLLMLSHKMEQAVDRTRKGDFSPRGLQGFDLQGKTFGVIGTGNIGRQAIRIARGFGMEVVAYDVEPDPTVASQLDFTYVEMGELLRRSDVISLHVPSTPQTRHLLSHEQFEQMKECAVIINTSRGDVIDSQALIRGLAEGKVCGAGLDVLSEEPVIREEAKPVRPQGAKYNVRQRRHSPWTSSPEST